MKRHLFKILATTVLLSVILSLAVPALADKGDPGNGNGKATLNPGIYVVQMSDQPVVTYKGGIPGLRATAPGQGKKIDPTSPAVIAYSSFLDVRHQVELFDVVRALARDGVAVLAALHDLNLAAEYCDRIVLLRDGAVAASGPTAEVFTYANLTRVYQTEVYVDRNDLTGALIVTPLSGRARARLAEQGFPRRDG